MKGIGVGLALLIIFVAGAVLSVVGISLWSLGLTKSLTIDVTYNEGKLALDKLHFDSEKNYLRNSLWVTCAYAAYKNGENGTVYRKSWPRLEGTDLKGRSYSYVSWKNLDHVSIPPQDEVISMLYNRINESYRKYFSHLEFVTISKNERGGYEVTPVNLVCSENECEVHYNISNLTLEGSYLNHTMEELHVKIYTKVGIRYLKLYSEAKNFVENIEKRMDEKLISELGHALMCTGDGRLSKDDAKSRIEEILQEIATDETGNSDNLKWDIHLLSIDSFKETSGPGSPPRYYDYDIIFRVNVTVQDADETRRVPAENGVKKLGIVFSVREKINFRRTVEWICESCSGCTGDARCGSGGSAYCSGNTRYFWSNMGKTEDCDKCFCKKKEDCSPNICCGGKCKCNPGEACCDGKCIDITSDESNCGGCGIHCGEDEECCNGVCVDINFDESNCGGCNKVCDKTCCFGECVDILSNNNYCGSCWKGCLPGYTCVGGKCV